MEKVADPQKFIGGNPMFNRERIKMVMIDAILEVLLKREGVKTLAVAAKRLGISKGQARYIFKRQHASIGLVKLADCCDVLEIKLTLNAIISNN